MVDSVSIPPIAPVQPASPASARPPAQPTSTHAHPVAPATESALSGSVQRAKNDEFVYALKDTTSGRIVVVVPHVELRSDGLKT